MEYSEAYQRSRDIDWFFHAGNRCIHVASNAGKLPDFVNDIQRLRKEQADVFTLPDNQDAKVVETQYVYYRVQAFVEESQKKNLQADIQEIHDSYIASFLAMARKGFYSYDRDLDDDSRYILICGPERPTQIGLQLQEMNNEIEFEGESIESFRIKTQYIEK